jgi:hypothetical protein
MWRTFRHRTCARSSCGCFVCGARTASGQKVPHKNVEQRGHCSAEADCGSQRASTLRGKQRTVSVSKVSNLHLLWGGTDAGITATEKPAPVVF